ncbi:anhydro-N-acetylmuramic acid kinase [Streptomyces capillispiralis]|uniref:Anhydro-N-acetylmuramic acid kinase n=1 Tax=Streptomyces capillispiralis TaxID=68182 RepID=A0A561TRS3_9ACTN|nr:anhydro-N-acetylmuramic acid kinase [Streptomyces capillispiralis]TWF89787.1 anhydro-N-acetylmuramic acid kinase [Streptomyces capillispiralis]GHH94112.1 anhydro-N-acetylmuramic acid kinase [Streptomyces capillispiralis]
MRIIGLMSGTSHDAVDAAAADITLRGDSLLLTPLGMVSAPYPTELRTALKAALPPAPTTMREVCRLDTRIGQAFAALAGRADRELCDGRADLVVSHGQTVYHWVEEGRVHGTLQIGSPAWIAEATGRPVVSDLRSRDVAAGGQGAPLVSLFDVMWLRGRPGTPAALNLGGIANLTVAAPTGDPVAFDTGPACALVDAAVHALTDGRLDYDRDGALAARGSVDAALLHRLLDEPYYAKPPPKTTGKELFHWPYLRAALDAGDPLPPEDVVATVTRLTARTVADAVRATGASEVVASGGGIRNPTLMDMLRTELRGTALRTSDDLGLPSAAKEAHAFAVLGYLTVQGLAGTVPSCTGARHPRVLGSITPGARALRLPEPAARPPVRLRVMPA